MPPITLRGGTIDPANAPEDLPADASETNFILIQTTHSLNRQESLELSNLGVQIQRLQDHNYTYLCRYEPAGLAPIEALPFVKHVIVYHSSFVIDWSLKNIDIDNHPSYLKVVRPNDGKKGEPLCEVNILLHQDTIEHGDDVFTELQEKFPDSQGIRKITSDAKHLRVQLPLHSLETVAAMDPVVAIYPAADDVLHLMESRKILDMDPAYLTDYRWYSSYQWMLSGGGPYKGHEQTIAIADSGMNDGVGPGSVNHPAFGNRIVNTTSIQSIGTPDKWQTLEDTHEESHGTHVAGCAAGRNWHLATNKKWNPTNQTYWKSCQMSGTAPEASIYVQKYKWKRKDGPEGTFTLAELTQDILDNCPEAKIYSHSYGTTFAGLQQSYESDGKAGDLDAFTFDHEEYTVLFAAGNNGRTTSVDPNRPRTRDTVFNEFNRQIMAVVSAKNCLTVGATFNGRDYDPYDDFVRIPNAPPPNFNERNTHEGDPEGMASGLYNIRFPPDPVNGPVMPTGREDPKTVCSSSSKGPTSSGYLKPEVVAPGAGILSAFSLNNTAQSRKAKKDPDDETGKYKPNYCVFGDMQFASGTSMAAPQVAGIAACIRQAAASKRKPDLLGSTVRAIIVNTAVSLKGERFFYLTPATKDGFTGWGATVGRLASPPDCIQGYGLVSYRRAIMPVVSSPRLDPSATQGYGWTGFHQVGVRSGSPGYFTDRDQRWPENLTTAGADMASYIYWSNPAHTQLKVTMAYNDLPSPVIEHELILTVRGQVIKADGTIRELGERPADPATIYPDMDAWAPIGERSVALGTVQRVTWPNIAPVQQGETLRFQMRVWAKQIMTIHDAAHPDWATPRVGFSLCWLASVDDNF